MSRSETSFHWTAPSDAVNFGGARLVQDANESDWDTRNPHLPEEVYCFPIAKYPYDSQDAYQSYIGLLLVADRSNSDGFRRVGHFEFWQPSFEVFEHAESRTVAIY